MGRGSFITTYHGHLSRAERSEPPHNSSFKRRALWGRSPCHGFRATSGPRATLLLLGSILALLNVTPLFAQATGGAFNLALERSVSMSSGESPLLASLQSLEVDQQIAILLDRRIDPDQIVGTDLRRMSLKTLVGSIASQVQCGISPVGDTLYVGPVTTVRKLRTLVEIQGTELRSAKVDTKRVFELVRRKPVTWDDLAEPRKLVHDIADSYQLQVDGLDLVPHDLWRTGHMASPNASEALLIILLQFDLSFEWLPGASGIQIIRAPESPSLERIHSPVGMTTDEARIRIREAFPDAIVSDAPKGLMVSGTVEEHDSLEYLLGEKTNRNNASIRKSVVLANQRFTLKARGQRCDLLLEALQLDGLDIEYDTEALSAAGIDLTTKLILELDKATIAQLLDAVCEQVPLKYSIRGNKVVLEAQSTRAVQQ